MAMWSRFLLGTDQKLIRANGLLGKLLPKNNKTCENQMGSIRRMSHHRVMDVTASRWQWHKTKDWMHFYFFVGAIPAGLIIFYANVFIGPATLEEIPEGYIPKPWEYYRHPISRFLARYCYPNQQQEYEKLLHYQVTAFEKSRLHQLERKIQQVTQVHNDYKQWSFKRNMSAKYVKDARARIDAEHLGLTDPPKAD